MTKRKMKNNREARQVIRLYWFLNKGKQQQAWKKSYLHAFSVYETARENGKRIYLNFIINQVLRLCKRYLVILFILYCLLRYTQTLFIVLFILYCLLRYWTPIGGSKPSPSLYKIGSPRTSLPLWGRGTACGGWGVSPSPLTEWGLPVAVALPHPSRRCRDTFP